MFTNDSFHLKTLNMRKAVSNHQARADWLLVWENVKLREEKVWSLIRTFLKVMNEVVSEGERRIIEPMYVFPYL